jgi:hypothetical protein
MLSSCSTGSLIEAHPFMKLPRFSGGFRGWGIAGLVASSLRSNHYVVADFVIQGVPRATTVLA